MGHQERKCAGGMVASNSCSGGLVAWHSWHGARGILFTRAAHVWLRNVHVAPIATGIRRRVDGHVKEDRRQETTNHALCNAALVHHLHGWTGTVLGEGLVREEATREEATREKATREEATRAKATRRPCKGQECGSSRPPVAPRRPRGCACRQRGASSVSHSTSSRRARLGE